jgi:serine/threonine protein kinase
MWLSKRISLQEIGIEGIYTIPSIPRIEPNVLSNYDTKKQCLIQQTRTRCRLRIDHEIDHGSYGTVFTAKRNEIDVLVKQPRMVEMNLLQEAVLQHLAHKTLEVEGLVGAIPRVYDVFTKGDSVCFSMEHIYGITIPEWFFKTKTPDLDMLLVVGQLALILGVLERHLNLDHRDLKHGNLLVKQEPSTIHVKLNDSMWRLQSPFTVVVLDFGFACLGSEMLRGKPLVNLGDGVLPPMDPCPKEGRDMFHLLTSLLGLPVIQQTISKRLHDKLDAWLTLGKKSYGPMARRWSTEHWSYLVSSQPEFAIPNCCPLRILQDLVPELKGALTRT